MKKLNVYMNVAENSGVGLYREYLPALALRESGLADVRINDFRWAEGDHVEPTDKVFFDTCNWADIIIAGRQDIPQYYAKWGAVREKFNVPVLMDTDDNVHNVRPTNPGYQGYYPGSDPQMWNQYAMSRIFDAMTVTTQDLVDYYKKFHPKIYILPNSLDIKDWESHPLGPKTDKIKMAFICSAAHSDGFSIIDKPVFDILEKYPNVEFYYPEMYWRFLETRPEKIKDQLKGIPWIPLKEWSKKMKENSFDIGLAPLKDNLFNRSKSNLRFLEFSMAGMATVASPVKPYLCIQDGKTGFLAKEQKEWYNAMDKLISDEILRKRIAINAYDYVKKNFDISKNAKLWYNAYNEIIEKFHDFYGPKKVFMETDKGKYREIGRPKFKV